MLALASAKPSEPTSCMVAVAYPATPGATVDALFSQVSDILSQDTKRLSSSSLGLAVAKAERSAENE